MDLTGTFRYFGSPDSKRLEADFTPEQRRDFVIRREILWESEDAADAVVRQKEIELIRELRSNDPSIGYNRWPKFKPQATMVAEASNAVPGQHPLLGTTSNTLTQIVDVGD